MNGLNYKLPRLQIILIPKRVLKYEEGRPRELRKGKDRTSTSTLSKCVVHSCAMKYHIRLANGPQTYYGCISVIEHYERNDLYALLKSLDKGVKDRNKEKVLEDKESLDKVIEGIWKDAIKIKNDAKAVSFGISIVMGVVGTIATSGALGPASLLAGLGFAGLEKILELDRLNVSERVVKLLNKDYLCNIYNYNERCVIR